MNWGYHTLTQDAEVSITLPQAYSSKYSVTATRYHKDNHCNYEIYLKTAKTVSVLKLHVYGYATGCYWMTAGY